MTTKPRLAIIGLVHGHIHWLTRKLDFYLEAFDLVGIAEADKSLIEKYIAETSLPEELFFSDAEAMLEQTRPEGVAVFTHTFDHLSAVQLCAPRGIHIMVEKPFAVSLEHATEMAELAKRHQVQLITNYETSWYATTHQAYKRIIEDGQLGALHKLVVHDGHKGPKEIGCSPEFLNWLLDPVLNGGGALMDFGCYGVNLMTWLMGNQKPLSVTAVTSQIKDDPAYRKVDDDATIILTYPKAQALVQGSWNWPIGRKDMELYGQKGYLYAHDATRLSSRLAGAEEVKETLEPLATPERDPFLCLAAVVRDKYQPSALWSIENNLIVVEVLDAARKSAQTGQAIKL